MSSITAIVLLFIQTINSCIIDLKICFDLSGSAKGKFQEQKDFVREYMRQVNELVGVEMDISLFTFNERTVLVKRSSNPIEITRSADKIQLDSVYGSKSDLYKCLKTSHEQPNKALKTKIMLILTDFPDYKNKGKIAEYIRLYMIRYFIQIGGIVN